MAISTVSDLHVYLADFGPRTLKDGAVYASDGSTKRPFKVIAIADTGHYYAIEANEELVTGFEYIMIGGPYDLNMEHRNDSGTLLRKFEARADNALLSGAAMVGCKAARWGAIARLWNNTAVLDLVEGDANFVGTKTVKANNIVLGTTVRMTAWGVYNVNGAGRTARFNVMGGGNILDTGTIAVDTTAGADKLWRADAEVICAVQGASGGVKPQLITVFAGNAVTHVFFPRPTASGNAALDTTIDTDWGLDLYLASGAVADSMTCQSIRVDIAYAGETI